ncbi:MAG: zinc ribbon domain-containing protein [Planctomycetes bacterium]|nr:zinc ribbon domain-containing protein [Planctomycetota bacterium]MCB9934803.1 zinc ribbon domain-containing protein [Planctomycetota bacterium]
MYYGWIHGYYAYEASTSAANSAVDAASSARRAENALARLEDALDRQALIIRTLLSMCEAKGLFNEPEFRELMNEVDLSDGRLDGKFKPQAMPRSCPNCGKTNGKRAVTCMYCGAQLEGRELI